MFRATDLAVSARVPQPSQDVRGERGEEMMKQLMILALMLLAVTVPLMGVAHADLKSDEAIEQAP